jgi:hypothetical protein
MSKIYIEGLSGDDLDVVMRIAGDLGLEVVDKPEPIVFSVPIGRMTLDEMDAMVSTAGPSKGPVRHRSKKAPRRW